LPILGSMAVLAEPPDGAVEAVLEELRARGGRVTTARRVLVEVLFDSAGHHTVDELAAAVQARAPEVHVSTIYRNLEELERLGVIEHSHLGHGPATYHLAAAAHAHLVCNACGHAEEAPDEMFAGLGRELMRRYGFRLDAHHFALLGRCRSCLQSGSPGDEA
jgi:Fur family ferric uptake transcriptional regulator